MISVLLAFVAPAVFTVGDGMQYSRIEDAVGAAPAGSVIRVYPKDGGYPQTAVRIQKAFLTIKAEGHVLLGGPGFEYSGDGPVPRAIFQVDAGGEGAFIQGFEFAGAHNSSHNGAGIRVNAANKVRIQDCDIHGNDMGIMSNGVQGNAHACEDLRINACKIHDNGDPADPGYNHNLYLGGTSVTLVDCDIFGAITGHNVKSRAHFLMVRNCHIHGGQNRQMDLVDAWDTEAANSNVVVIYSTIEMNPDASGNRNVIHFGQEKGKRNGTLFLIDTKIVSPFLTPVFQFDASSGEISLQHSLIESSYATPHPLASTANGGALSSIGGFGNSIAKSIDLAGTKLSPATGEEKATPFYFDGDGKRRGINGS